MTTSSRARRSSSTRSRGVPQQHPIISPGKIVGFATELFGEVEHSKRVLSVASFLQGAGAAFASSRRELEERLAGGADAPRVT